MICVLSQISGFQAAVAVLGLRAMYLDTLAIHFCLDILVNRVYSEYPEAWSNASVACIPYKSNPFNCLQMTIYIPSCMNIVAMNRYNTFNNNSTLCIYTLVYISISISLLYSIRTSRCVARLGVPFCLGTRGRRLLSKLPQRVTN